MTDHGRPLSPHLTIYRWPITMVLSILHRLSGLAMSLGLIALAAWLMSAAAGAASYAQFVATMNSIPGRVLLVGWSLAFFYHLANGVRHLVWDTGHGFERAQANASSWLVIALSVAATALFWVLAT